MATPAVPITNLTLDDFDAVLNYSDQTQWTTPDPWSLEYNSDSKEWLRGTWHVTDVVGAEVSLGFDGPSLWIYGHSGPSYGSYSITIDDQVTLTRSAYAASNVSTPYLLYGTTNLTDSAHTVRLRNLGKQQSLGDGGGNRIATVENVTLEETSPQITYTGFWGSNQSGNFSSGGSTYTNDLNASFTLTFNASTIYIFGDKKNDHGLYTVQLDGGPVETYDGISGCGGVFGTSCEQQLPSVKWFRGRLGEGEHKVTVMNLRGNPEGKGGINGTFFDLDSIVLSVPSKYESRNSSGSNGTGTGTGNGSGSSSESGSSGVDFNGVFIQGIPFMSLLWAIMLVWLVRKAGRM
ncbi:hypothetical protein L218DRAFT_975779 [Marasmius fiardii PR-910]|nr:hypothetical protein L218DRAFT_975779 [Marasmius fiardii PR-910]